MPILVDNIATLLPDQDGELAAFLDRYLSLEGMRIFANSGELDELRVISPLEESSQIVLTIAKANWPESPTPQINTLYWPTGATRWASCLLLADDLGKNAIVNSANVDVAGDKYASAVNIVFEEDGYDGVVADGFSMDSQHRVSLKTEMYLLKPRPVAMPSGETKLWVLPLVDERYFWQWKHVGSTKDIEAENWEEFLKEIVSILSPAGAEYIESLPPAYDWKPDLLDKDSLSYANAAILLDAAAMSVGLRVVRNFDGSLNLFSSESGRQTWLSSTSSSRSQIYGIWSQISGGDFTTQSGAASFPESVTVLMPGGNAIIKTQEDLEVSLGFASDTTKLFRVPYLPESYDETERSDLAKQIAKDFFGWRERHGDMSFTGLKPWEMNGFEDYVSIEFGSPGRAGEMYQAQTRVVSLPPNFSISTMLAAGMNTVSGGSGSGSSTCECGTPVEVGTVEIGGVKYAMSYSFPDPLGSNGTIVVTYDEELGSWVSDDYEVDCPEDPEPEEEDGDGEGGEE